MKNPGVIVFVLIAALVGVVGYGWIHNIVLLTRMDCGWCAKEIVRVAGIFVPPLGWVMGYVP